jgi:(heptosyl)LPS beta-1,4-glucosyltransferase
MATLSVAVIVQDEEENLPGCLESVRWADEIVVVDSGSTDATVEVARRYTDKVFIETDWQGCGIQRHRAQERASGDWVLVLDADERVSPELAEEIRAAVARDARDRVYAFPRLAWCFGRFIRHGGWYPLYETRLYPRERARSDTVRVHTKVQYPEEMTCERLSGDLIHYTYHGVEHYSVKSARYARDWADERQALGQRAGLLQAIVHGLACFVRMYLVRGGFRDARAGLLLAVLSAHSTFVKYAELWLRSQPGRPEKP